MIRKVSECEGWRTKEQILFIQLEKVAENGMNEYLEWDKFSLAHVLLGPIVLS